MQVTECECVAPGWCERHQCHKSPMWFKACQRLRPLFALWENGRGPGQNKHSKPRDTTSCRHRGERMQTVKCPSCRGDVQLKVYRCDLHIQCTLARSIQDTACCGLCDDYDEGDAGSRRTMDHASPGLDGP
jgi:hypothetical protein